ncbi:MAG: hypothetical protein C0499_05290, partial [Zymomonas sp.]|nr:hypothetical protein [Zymomonas sp.]
GLVTTRLAPILAAAGDPSGEALSDDPVAWDRTISRNAACPCGSGKKYKHCHGVL